MKLFLSLALTVFVALGNNVGAQQLRALSTGVVNELPSQLTKKKGKKAPKKSHGMEAQITMSGLTHDNPKEQNKYFKVLSNAFVESFNAVAPKGTITMDSMEVEKEIDVPEDNSPSTTIDGVSGLGESAALTAGKSWWSGFYSWIIFVDGTCDLCAEDDDSWDYRRSPPIVAFLKTDPAVQNQFEDTLCQLLRDSGLDTFSGVSNCKVVYLHKPHDGPTVNEDPTVNEE